VTTSDVIPAAPRSARHDDLRAALARLAELEGGRRLLQLAVRGLERGDAQLDAGCWRRRADAGCLFQHSYWEGVRTGAFAADEDARAWVSRVAGEEGWTRVIDVIAAFDALARAEYRTLPRGRLVPPARRLDRGAWRATVLQLLVQALSDRTGPLASPDQPVVQYANL
jgi:hypothetical protein